MFPNAAPPARNTEQGHILALIVLSVSFPQSGTVPQAFFGFAYFLGMTSTTCLKNSSQLFLYNVTQFGFFKCFLVIGFWVCIFGWNATKQRLDLSQGTMSGSIKCPCALPRWCQNLVKALSAFSIVLLLFSFLWLIHYLRGDVLTPCKHPLPYLTPFPTTTEHSLKILAQKLFSFW